MIKPKILFIMHMPPPVHGAAMMGQYIHDSRLVNETFECRYINPTTASSIEDIGSVGIGKLLRFIKLLLKVFKTVRRFKPDLVYFTPVACGGAFYRDFVVTSLLKLLRCRIVVHYHNKGVATRQDRWLDDKLYHSFFRGIKVILLSDALFEDVKKYVSREDVLICPNGIPETLKDVPTAHRNNAVPRLLFLSNLLVSKGVLVLLDACKILKDRGYSFICDIVGAETAEIDAERLDHEIKSRGLNEVAVYGGRKFGSEKHECLSEADVFVFPTYSECFGLVLLEAMEHKLPVVSTGEGGIVDVIKDGENGYISEKKCPESLAVCIGRLLDDEKLRHSMGEDGYRKFKEKFTLKAFEQNLSDVLKDVNGGGNP